MGTGPHDEEEQEHEMSEMNGESEAGYDLEAASTSSSFASSAPLRKTRTKHPYNVERKRSRPDSLAGFIADDEEEEDEGEHQDEGEEEGRVEVIRTNQGRSGEGTKQREIILQRSKGDTPPPSSERRAKSFHHSNAVLDDNGGTENASMMSGSDVGMSVGSRTRGRSMGAVDLPSITAAAAAAKFLEDAYGPDEEGRSHATVVQRRAMKGQLPHLLPSFDEIQLKIIEGEDDEDGSETDVSDVDDGVIEESRKKTKTRASGSSTAVTKTLQRKTSGHPQHRKLASGASGSDHDGGGGGALRHRSAPHKTHRQRHASSGSLSSIMSTDEEHDENGGDTDGRSDGGADGIITRARSKSQSRYSKRTTTKDEQLRKEKKREKDLKGKNKSKRAKKGPAKKKSERKSLKKWRRLRRNLLVSLSWLSRLLSIIKTAFEWPVRTALYYTIPSPEIPMEISKRQSAPILDENEESTALGERVPTNGIEMTGMQSHSSATGHAMSALSGHGAANGTLSTVIGLSFPMSLL